MNEIDRLVMNREKVHIGINLSYALFSIYWQIAVSVSLSSQDSGTNCKRQLGNFPLGF